MPGDIHALVGEAQGSDRPQVSDECSPCPGQALPSEASVSGPHFLATLLVVGSGFLAHCCWGRWLGGLMDIPVYKQGRVEDAAPCCSAATVPSGL